jgi:glycyl-tRNA synthetase beta subunit
LRPSFFGLQRVSNGVMRLAIADAGEFPLEVVFDNLSRSLASRVLYERHKVESVRSGGAWHAQ